VATIRLVGLGVALDANLDALYSGIGSSLPNDEARTYSTTADREFLTIGEMARESGATPRALRFYEGKGLISPQRRGAARFYGRIERERLALVLKAKRLGFTLGEIRQMLDGEQAELGALSISRSQCFDQITLLEQRKRDIESALAELRRTYSSFYARVAGGGA
jgi:DNA-binding transcriptional MerR regulator